MHIYMQEQALNGATTFSIMALSITTLSTAMKKYSSQHKQNN